MTGGHGGGAGGDRANERIAALERRVAELTRELGERRPPADDRLVRSFVDALPVMISFIDRDGRYRFVNRAYEEWFGRPADAIVGRPAAEVLGPDAWALRRPYAKRALAGERVRYQAPFHHPDGLRRTLLDHIPYVEDGAVLGYCVLVQDVTDQWRALEAATESEARFRRIADSAPVPIWVDAPDHAREFVNAAYAEFAGLPQPQAAALDWRTALHPDDRARIAAEVEAGRAGRGRFALEARFRRADGQWRWLRATVQPRVDAAGAPEGAIGVAEDVTEARAATGLLQRRADDLALRLGRLWDLSRDPIAILDAGGVWRDASPAWTAVLGWPADRLVGRTSRWLEHPDDRAAADAMRAALAGGQAVRDVLLRMRATDGAWRCVSWSAVPEAGVTYAAGRDVTAERDQAAALDDAAEQLRQGQKMEALGQLTGGVAHDFNNLLTPILGALDLLARRLPPGDRSARLVEGAARSAERARTLVQRLLAYARRQPLEPGPVALGPLVEGMGDLLRSTLGPTVEVALALDPACPPAMADANQLEMALLNLAVNARDAMPGGGRLTVTVAPLTLEARRGELAPGRYARLCVADTGAGMDEDTLRRAAEPFFSTKPRGAGTGLGLSMVHGVAGQLGGALSIASRPGEGTAVELLLPATRPGSAEARRADGDADAPPMSVLLVDDDPLVRAGVEAMLADLGHRVTPCGGGPEALGLLDRGLAPDLLVTDQVMPQMSGTQLVEAVRGRFPALRTLMISGYPQGDDRGRLAVQRLPKPFTRAQLARAVSAVWGAGAG